LTAKRFHHLQKIRIGLYHFVTQKLDDTVNLAAGEEGKRECAAQIRFCGNSRPREIWIMRYVVNPGWFF